MHPAVYFLLILGFNGTETIETIATTEARQITMDVIHQKNFFSALSDYKYTESCMSKTT